MAVPQNALPSLRRFGRKRNGYNRSLHCVYQIITKGPQLMLRALLIYSSLGTTVRAASMDLPMEYQNTLSRLGSRSFASPRAA